MDRVRAIFKKPFLLGLLGLILALLATLPFYAPPYTPILLIVILMYIIIT
ncbi:unnamed protein product, partial [marine sediment metagenome]